MAYSQNIVDALNHAIASSEAVDRPQVCSAKAINFACGCVVAIDLDIDDTGNFRRIDCRSNGCGHIFDRAKRLNDLLIGRNTADVTDVLSHISDEHAAERPDCRSAVVAAFEKCLADVRSRRNERFEGDSPLICSCFGVAESDILEAIKISPTPTMESLSELTRAGSGCGACRFVLAELLESER